MGRGQSKKATSTRRFCATTRVLSPVMPTRRSVNALLPFGLCPARNSDGDRCATELNPSLLAPIQSSSLTLITGPSGSGKSTLLRSLVVRHAQSGSANPTQCITPGDLGEIDQSVPIVNLFTQPLDDTLSLLSAVGLAEPTLWGLPECALSTGQQARLQVARLFSHASAGSTIILDELATPLDRLTARSLCSSLKKVVDHFPEIRIIAAGAHEDLPAFLDTDLLINAADSAILPNRFVQERIIYEMGTLDDYHALKQHHYISRDPASIVRVDRAMRRCPVTDALVLAGVLVVAYPTLNSSWRDRAWPGRYTTSDKSANAKRVNKEIRRLARIIVDPRSRGMGIASTLVRNYLVAPLTDATEACAAMGSTNPFFKHAGMIEYPIPLHPTDLRLLDALTHLDMTPHTLLDQSAPVDPLIEREISIWARSKSLDPNDPEIQRHAAFKLLTKPCAFTHSRQRGDK